MIESTTEFIFMLTQNDVTIPNALDVLEQVKDTGLRYVGCKDIGLTKEQYSELFRRTKKYKMITFLEVVTADEQKHFGGVDLALNMGVDYLIGGMPQFTRKTLEYLREKEKRPQFYPYVGEIVSHPCILQGSVEEIVDDGLSCEKLGVDGINLLLYRYTGDQKRLLDATVEKFKVPLIVAGTVRSFAQIEELKEKKIWAFTIGGAIIEKEFVKQGSLKEQVRAVLKAL